MIENDTIAEILKVPINLGIAGFFLDDNNEEDVRLTYAKPAVMGEVFSPNELVNPPDSKNMIEAYKNGCKTEDEMLAYTHSILENALKKAVKTGVYQTVDTIGMFHCKDNNEECNWDMIYEVVTPKGDILYVRQHTWQ